jgi:uncharacterized coiled-coil protein SlyX
MTDRSTEIEIKLAHLEQALNEMSDVVYAQQASIDALELKCEALRQRAMTAESAGDTDRGEEKPPHY